MLDIDGMWSLAGRTRVRVSLSNALARDRDVGEGYASADGGVSRRIVTRGFAGVRVTLERPL